MIFSSPHNDDHHVALERALTIGKLRNPQPRLLVSVDRARAARLGVGQSEIVAAIATAIRGEDVSYLHTENSRRPVPIRLELEEGEKADPDVIAHLRVRNAAGDLVPLSEVAHFTMTTREQAIYHKDLRRVAYVYAEPVGRAPAEVVAKERGKLANLQEQADKLRERLAALLA